jgi:hypothetical protein
MWNHSMDEVLQWLDDCVSKNDLGQTPMMSSTDEGKTISYRLFGNGPSRPLGIHRVTAITHGDAITDLTFQIGRQGTGLTFRLYSSHSIISLRGCFHMHDIGSGALIWDILEKVAAKNHMCSVLIIGPSSMSNSSRFLS